jgi:hypothetical protein
MQLSLQLLHINLLKFQTKSHIDAKCLQLGKANKMEPQIRKDEVYARLLYP